MAGKPKEIENKAGELVEKIVEAFCKDEIAEGKRDALDMEQVHAACIRIADSLGMVAEERTISHSPKMTSAYIYLPKSVVGKKIFVVRFVEKAVEPTPEPAPEPAKEVETNANTDPQ
jgi:hypothetical protein